jgi:hypothetical protein
MPGRSLLDGFDLIVVVFWAAASSAFDREDASNLVWPQMGASEVSLTNGAFSYFPHPFSASLALAVGARFAFSLFR